MNTSPVKGERGCVTCPNNLMFNRVFAGSRDTISSITEPLEIMITIGATIEAIIIDWLKFDPVKPSLFPSFTVSGKPSLV